MSAGNLGTVLLNFINPSKHHQLLPLLRNMWSFPPWFIFPSLGTGWDGGVSKRIRCDLWQQSPLVVGKPAFWLLSSTCVRASSSPGHGQATSWKDNRTGCHATQRNYRRTTVCHVVGLYTVNDAQLLLKKKLARNSKKKEKKLLLLQPIAWLKPKMPIFKLKHWS